MDAELQERLPKLPEGYRWSVSSHGGMLFIQMQMKRKDNGQWWGTMYFQEFALTDLGDSPTVWRTMIVQAAIVLIAEREANMVKTLKPSLDMLTGIYE